MNISEIAKLAGVSSAAVSRYFNQGYLSEEKKEAIRRVVEKTGYRPSLQAQTLRTKKTKLVGVILPKINSASLGRVVAGILSVLDENGYKMLLADTQNDPKRELEYLTVFNEKQVDGVLFLATVFTEEHKKLFKTMEIPVVIVGQYMTGMNCVYHDDYHAALELSRLVLERGSKNPGFISAIHEDKAAGYDRYRGFCDALREAGLAACAANFVISDFTLEGGRKAAGELLARFPEVDAVIGATDTIAVGAMHCLKEKGVKIPEELLFAGFGDSSYSQVTTPTLTTVHYSYEESGIQAARLLMDLLENPETSVRGVMMGFYIVEKESTNRIRAVLHGSAE